MGLRLQPPAIPKRAGLPAQAEKLTGEISPLKLTENPPSRYPEEWIPDGIGLPPLTGAAACAMCSGLGVPIGLLAGAARLGPFK